MRLNSGRIRSAAALAIACGLLAVSACSDEDEQPTGISVEPGPDAVAEAERLYQIINEGRAVTDELTEIEYRVTKRCLEDKGFTVHDPAQFAPVNSALYGAAGYLTDAPVRAVPTPEAAAQWGFGQWIDHVYEDEDLAEELLTPEARAAFNLPTEDVAEPDSSEWDAQGKEYQAEWIEAYWGSPAYDDGMKVQLDTQAPPGGCWLQMVETMYGEPYTVEGEDGEESFPRTHAPSPVIELGEFEGYEEDLRAEVGDEADAFDSCLIDAGYEGWELGDEFFPPLWLYFSALYSPEMAEELGNEEGVEVPDAPEDIAGDFTAVLEHERAMAGDFAACGQESGLREAVEQAWAALLVERFQPIETDLVAWQQQMQEHLDSAQEYLEA